MKVIRTGSDISAATQKSERIYLRSFERFASRLGPPWPAHPDVLCKYLDKVSRRASRSTFTGIRCAIRRKHRDNGWEDPFDLPLVLAAARVAAGNCVQPEVKVLRSRDVAALLDAMPATQLGARDALIFLLKLCGGLTDIALSRLNRTDVSFYHEGMRIATRTRGGEFVVTIREHAADTRYCPVAIMRRYIAMLPDDGPALLRIARRGLLRKGRLGSAAIAVALAHYRLPGSDAITGRQLRATAIVMCTHRGASDYAIMRQMGFKSVRSVRAWQQRYAPATRNLTEKLGL
jgi:integrase